MKNSLLLVIAIVAVATVLIPIFYTPLTDHYRYTAPIKNSEIVPNYTHVDSIPFTGINDTFSDNMYDITLSDPQTVKISFRNHGKLPPWSINDFEDFEREFSIGDSFVTCCKEEPENSSSFLSIFQFNDTRQIGEETFVDLIHAEASSKEFIPCNYPKIVDYSTNVFELR